MSALSLPSAGYAEIPVKDLVPSPENPRREIGPDGLQELAASIAKHGILEPLLVRINTSVTNGLAEIVCGERRWRAAQEAGLERVPCVVRELSDREALEASIVENIQREDMHPLEEADAVAALAATDTTHTADTLGALLGKSVTWIRTREAFANLDPEPRKAFESGELGIGHAIALSKLTPADQAQALEYARDTLFDETVVSVGDLRDWIKHNTVLNVEAELESIPELREALEGLPGGAASLVPLANSTVPGDHPDKPLLPHHWRKIDSKRQTCKHAERGVIVIGNNRGAVVDFCRHRQECAKHWPKAPAGPPATRSKVMREIEDRHKQSAADQRLWEKTVRDQVAAELLALSGSDGLSWTPAATTALLSLGYFRLDGPNRKLADRVRSKDTSPVGKVLFLSLIKCSAGYEHERTELTKILKPFGISVPSLMTKARRAAAPKAAKKTGKKAGRPSGSSTPRAKKTAEKSAEKAAPRTASSTPRRKVKGGGTRTSASGTRKK